MGRHPPSLGEAAQEHGQAYRPAEQEAGRPQRVILRMQAAPT